MIKADLITGFLGAGKTTFLRGYAAFLLADGQRIGIVENDFGAINIDRMLLNELEGEHCHIEQVLGGNTLEDWKRRFKTKLIALAMQGIDRVVIEPSGVFDMDTFFDVMCDEPVCNLYEIGSVFTVVEAALDCDMSEKAEYLLMTQAACCGTLLLSRADAANVQQQAKTAAYLSALLEKYGCKRKLDGHIVAKPWTSLTRDDYVRLIESGYARPDYRELHFDESAVFTPLFFMNTNLDECRLSAFISELFAAPSLGTVLRVKGFIKSADGWTEINATRDHTEHRPTPTGQNVIIIIGESLNKAAVTSIFEKYEG